MTSNDLQIIWLTQGGFLLEHDSYRLVVDPYLSDAAERQEGLTRLAQPPLGVDELNPSALLCSHDHIDHLDPIAVPALMKNNPDCLLLGPDSVLSLAKKLGVEKGRTSKLGQGDRAELGPFKVVATPARHSDPDAVGFLINGVGYEIYISGDTLYSPDMAGAIKGFCYKPLDLALVCINGRMNNMTYQDALLLVSQLSPKLAAPMHYGLFKENTIDPDPFITRCREIGINCVALEPGRPVSLARLVNQESLS
jgi:L-ascorbate 6-phosphate lactonase